jgi:small-conductance mechanosensitive channel
VDWFDTETARTILHRDLFTIAGTPVSMVTLLTALLVIVVTVWISRAVQAGLVRFLQRRGLKDEGTAGVAGRLAHYLVIGAGVGVALQTLGIDLTALFAAGAFLAVAFGFAMQNITQNFVSGVILLIERTIKPGDILLVEGRMVRVSRLGTRATVARTLDDEDVIIPNSILVQSTVTNYTLRDSHYRVRVGVGVAYGSDMALVRKTLERVARDLEWRSRVRDPVVFLLAFGSSSVDWEVSAWIEDPWKERSYRSRLHEAVWNALQAAGITIAFPQLDVHFDAPAGLGSPAPLARRD